jgi:hypothetical protein
MISRRVPSAAATSNGCAGDSLLHQQPLPQLGQGPGQQARNVHLRDAHLLGDLSLGHVGKEAQQQNALLARREILKKGLEGLAVLNALQRFLLRTERGGNGRGLVVRVGDVQGQRGVRVGRLQALLPCLLPSHACRTPRVRNPAAPRPVCMSVLAAASVHLAYLDNERAQRHGAPGRRGARQACSRLERQHRRLRRKFGHAGRGWVACRRRLSPRCGPAPVRRRGADGAGRSAPDGWGRRRAAGAGRGR